MRKALSSEVPRATIASSSDGNAASSTLAAQATKLATARKVDLVNFDGTADISTGPCILSTTTGIDAKSVATTALYTVPAAKTAIITGAVVRVTVAAAITVVPTLGIGRNATQDDIFASTTLTGLDATTKVYVFDALGTFAVAAATEVVSLGIDTGATATTMTISIDLIGYILWPA